MGLARRLYLLQESGGDKMAIEIANLIMFTVKQWKYRDVNKLHLAKLPWHVRRCLSLPKLRKGAKV